MPERVRGFRKGDRDAGRRSRGRSGRSLIIVAAVGSVVLLAGCRASGTDTSSTAASGSDLSASAASAPSASAASGSSATEPAGTAGAGPVTLTGQQIRTAVSCNVVPWEDGRSLGYYVTVDPGTEERWGCDEAITVLADYQAMIADSGSGDPGAVSLDGFRCDRATGTDDDVEAICVRDGLPIFSRWVTSEG